MVKRETEICDFCNDRIGTYKCEVCEKDTCSDCGGYQYGDEGLIGKSIGVCKNCQILEIDKEFIKKLRKELLTHLKKQAIMVKLEEEKDDEGEYINKRCGKIKSVELRRIMKQRMNRIKK